MTMIAGCSIMFGRNEGQEITVPHRCSEADQKSVEYSKVEKIPRSIPRATLASLQTWLSFFISAFRLGLKPTQRGRHRRRSLVWSRS